MRLPEYFKSVPVLTMYDPLAECLGAAEDGIIDYRYEDAVRLAGHSCPTVAMSYALTYKGLAALYGEALPEQGRGQGGVRRRRRSRRDRCDRVHRRAAMRGRGCGRFRWHRGALFTPRADAVRGRRGGGVLSAAARHGCRGQPFGAARAGCPRRPGCVP